MGGCLCVTAQPHMESGPLLATINLAKDLRAILMVYHAMSATHATQYIGGTCVNICEQ